MQYLILIVLFLIHPLGIHASETEGSIDTSNKYARVCHDETCTSYGTINFKPTINANTPGADPIEITDSGITGHAWGDEVGWILLNPTGAGVSIDPNTGELSGYAYAHTGGWLNFDPSSVSGGTEVGVSITEDGEFYGWAWLSGAYGGWIKFDCTEISTCVTTDWRPASARMENETENSRGNTTGSSRMSPSSLGSTTPPAPSLPSESEYTPSGAPEIIEEDIQGEIPFFEGIGEIKDNSSVESTTRDDESAPVTQYFRTISFFNLLTIGEVTTVEPTCIFCLVIRYETTFQNAKPILKWNITPRSYEIPFSLERILQNKIPFRIDLVSFVSILVLGFPLLFFSAQIITRIFMVTPNTFHSRK